MIQADVSSMIQDVGIPQVRICVQRWRVGLWWLVGDNHSAMERGSSSRDSQICCPPMSILQGFGGSLDPLWVTEGIYMVKCACEPERLMEDFPVYIKIKALLSPAPARKWAIIKLTWQVKRPCSSCPWIVLSHILWISWQTWVICDDTK